MLAKMTPIRGKGQNLWSRPTTSTPRKKKSLVKKDPEVEALFMELSGEDESMPQVYPSHYFNIWNMFGIGCSNYKVSTVEQSHRKFMTGHSSDKSIPMQVGLGCVA
jgi:hypothetical protein